jgi:hypothetical protein
MSNASIREKHLDDPSWFASHPGRVIRLREATPNETRERGYFEASIVYQTGEDYHVSPFPRALLTVSQDEAIDDDNIMMATARDLGLFLIWLGPMPITDVRIEQERLSLAVKHVSRTSGLINPLAADVAVRGEPPQNQV